MRPLPPSFKSIFFGFAIALAADGAQAQTVTITGGPGTLSEGNSPPANTPFIFTIAKTPGPTGGTTAVTYTLTGTATAPEDYNALSGTINLTNASPSRTITVNIKRDTKFEVDESLTLTLTGASAGYAVAPPACGGCETATILNDDTQPTVKVGWNNVAEGAGTALVTVTLSNKSYQAVSVDAATSDGTAVAPADYYLNSTPLLYGVNSANNANGLLYLDPSTGAITGGQVITVGIHTISSAKALTIDPTTGTAYAVVQSEVGRLLATLDLATGTGVEIGVLSPGNLVSLAFNAAGQLFGVTGSSGGGALFSIDKTTAVTTLVASLANGSFGQAIAYRATDNSFYHWANDGIITFEKVLAAPPYTITPIATVSGSEVFGAGWNPQTDQFITTHFSNSAVDFWSPAGVVSNPQAGPGGKVRGMAFVFPNTTTISISPDSLTATFPVSIVQDLTDENNETFTVTLANPVNATLGSPFALTHSILDDDAPPTVSISPASASVVEGNSGTQLVMFTATLSAASGKTVTVGTATTPGTASSPSDYAVLPIPSGVTFNPGETSKVFAASVKGDGVLEPDEMFSVNVVPNGTTSTAGSPTTATVTIQNDDSPALVVSDPVQVEGLSGTTNMMFMVSITSPAPAGGVGFDFVTSDGSATVASGDYVLTSGTVSGTLGGILAGNMSATILVPINGDAAVEGHETLTLTISNPTGTLATILDNQGVGTIENDDLPAPGDLVISEFALRGNYFNGEGCSPSDLSEFVEIANNTALPITIGALGDTSPTGGFSVATAAGGGTYLFTIPNGTVIPARGHFLGGSDDVTFNQGYTNSCLRDYGGPGAAAEDATWTTPIADNTGLALFGTSTPSAAFVDKVGFVGDAYEKGTGLTPITNPGAFSAYGSSWVRRHAYGGGPLQNTPNNSDDFVLVDPEGAIDIDTTVTVSVLGGASPENLFAETERTSAELAISLLDPSADQFAEPDNYHFTAAVGGSNPKSVELRRIFTNNSGGSLSAIRFKVTSLSTLNSNDNSTLVPNGSANTTLEADFRPTSSNDYTSSFPTANGLTLEDPPFYNNWFFVPDNSNQMGGLNSSLRLNSGLPLGNTVPVGVNFKLFYTTSGVPGFFWVTVEAKP